MEEETDNNNLTAGEDLDGDCWGWEVDIDIGETDLTHHHETAIAPHSTNTTSHTILQSALPKDIRISFKSTLSRGFTGSHDSESSIISRVKSSPSFQELERAIGATLAIGLSDTDPLTKKEEHVKVINGVISHKASLKKNIQQRSYNSLRKVDLDSQRAVELRNDLKPFFHDSETTSRALLLFHSTDVISFDIKVVCQSFGSLSYFRSDFHSLGLTLLCYFDHRCAVDAYRLLPSRLGRLAAATVFYSVILQVPQNTDESLVRLCNIPSLISEVAIQEAFAQYGPLKSIQKSFIDQGVVPPSSTAISSPSISASSAPSSSTSSPSLCDYTIEYFNFQDAKVAMSEINSNFTSEALSSSLPSNLVKLGITSALLTVPFDRHQEQRRKELLNLLSVWRTRLHSSASLHPHHSSEAMPVSGPHRSLSDGSDGADGNILAPLPMKKCDPGHDQAVSIHSSGVTVIYPDANALVHATPPPLPALSSPAPEGGASTAVSSGQRGMVSSVSSGIVAEVVAQYGLNTETAEERVARHVMEAKATSAASASAQGGAPPAAATPSASTPALPLPPTFPYHPSSGPPHHSRMITPPYFDPSMAMFPGYPLPFPAPLQSPPHSSSPSDQLGLFPSGPPSPGQYGLFPPQYSTFIVQSPYGPMPVTVVSPFASPQGSYDNLYALGMGGGGGGYPDSEMWNGNGSQHQSSHKQKSRNHHQQYHKQRQQQQQQQQQQRHYSSTVPLSYDPTSASPAVSAPAMFPGSDHYPHSDQDGHYERLMPSASAHQRPPHHNGGHNAVKRGGGGRGEAKVSPASINAGGAETEYHLSPEQILSGGDNRTTLMIRNIPNKYSQSMLLEEINLAFDEAYDFFYLPIDFKNKCNVGYAFINLLSSADLLRFYQTFHGTKWRNFNSEKVCAVSYARIQGKAAMVTRFQNSSLLEKDESYKPLLFVSKGPDKGKPEPFPMLRAGGGHGAGGHAMNQQQSYYYQQQQQQQQYSVPYQQQQPQQQMRYEVGNYSPASAATGTSTASPSAGDAL